MNFKIQTFIIKGVFINYFNRVENYMQGIVLFYKFTDISLYLIFTQKSKLLKYDVLLIYFFKIIFKMLQILLLKQH